MKSLVVASLVPLTVIACSTEYGAAPDTPALELLERSLDFHDPGRLWGQNSVKVTWNGTGSEGEERVAVVIEIGPDQDDFSLEGRYRGHDITYSTSRTSVETVVDGSATMSSEVRETMRLDREDGFFWRSYFGYLAGLPMKLGDPGTHIDPDPIDTEFMGRPVQAIRVTYDADVGGDTWYFYFDPESAELVGCRFYHDEAANDGEYIVFEGRIEGGGLTLPRSRSWYMNADDRFLGTDRLTTLETRSSSSGG